MGNRLAARRTLVPDLALPLPSGYILARTHRTLAQQLRGDRLNFAHWSYHFERLAPAERHYAVVAPRSKKLVAKWVDYDEYTDLCSKFSR